MSTNDYHITSSCLGERRTITVFLPPNHDSASNSPVLLCADGQAVGVFSQRIERDIAEEELLKIVLVGVHSSHQRSQEYTLGHDDLRFRRHEQFFAEELPDWVHAEFGLPCNRSKTGVFGFSHGGAFALTMAARHRDLFGLVIAFSTAGDFQQFQIGEHESVQSPRFYLSAGTREKPLLKATRRLAKHLKRQRIDYVLTERQAGHDYGYWNSELPIALKWGFAPDSRPT